MTFRQVHSGLYIDPSSGIVLTTTGTGKNVRTMIHMPHHLGPFITDVDITDVIRRLDSAPTQLQRNQ